MKTLLLAIFLLIGIQITIQILTYSYLGYNIYNLTFRLTYKHYTRNTSIL